MQLLNLRDVVFGFADRILFSIPQLDIYSGERIGLIGENGSGKSTLLRLLIGDLEPEQGVIQRFGDWQLLRQFDDAFTADQISETDIAVWGIADIWHRETETMSGGEKMRSRLAKTFHTPGDILLLDEPSSNLDLEAIEQLSGMLYGLETFLLISHDRALLDEHCTRILDIREGRLYDYPGSYQAYTQWKAADLERRQFEYEQYLEEKRRLESVATDLKRRSHQVTKRPHGLSASEAKQRDFIATSRSYDGKSRSLASAAKHNERRIEQLEVKEKPEQTQVIRPDFSLTDPPRNRIVAESSDLSLAFDTDRKIFDEAAFQLKGNVRTALTGPNGSGKSCFCKMLCDGSDMIRTVPKARFGFFRQEMEWIDMRKTVLENVRIHSCQNETVDRSVLARMGFPQRRVHQLASTLSGGEQIKLSFAMLFVSAANVLVLDEPTNFLDIPSMEAIESLLLDYEGTLLFVSHDRHFVDHLADEIWQIEDGKIRISKTAEDY